MGLPAFPRIALAVTLTLTASLSLTGCAPSHPFVSDTPIAATIEGSLHGGQQPVAGSKIYLYAASTTGYGTASISRLSGAGYVLSDANGAFSLSAQNTCTSTDLLYAVATGGNPGGTVTTSNPAIAMMAVVGLCGSLSSGTFININELTTVAAATALAPFMTDATHVATSSTNIAGLTNAFATANNLVSTQAGRALTTTAAGNGTVPTREINSFANSIAACINTDGTGAPCANLFTYAQPTGGALPTDTLTAALDIALTPSANGNAANIFNLGLANGPFQPTLPTAPADWSMVITYTAGLSSPLGMAIDANGNIWASNYGGNNLSVINPLGAVVNSNYTGGGLSGPTAMAFDIAGNAWATNNNANSISEFSASGAPVSPGAGYIGGGLSNNSQIAIDGGSKVWAANYGNTTISKFNPFGVPIASSGISGFSSAWSIAVDPSGFVWVGNRGDGSIIKLQNDGANPTKFPLGIIFPSGIAIDSNSNVWIASYSSSSVVRLNSSGVVQATYTTGGIKFPYSIALDGGGNAWVGDSYQNGISRIQASNGVATLYNIPAGLDGNPGAIAADQSGNVWLVGGNNFLEFVGAAVPTTQPYATAIANGKLATRP